MSCFEQTLDLMRDWGGNAYGWATVLRCAVGGADGGSGLWWPEPMMEVACMHVWAPHRTVMWTTMLHHQI
jgi:hypothetical protein